MTIKQCIKEKGWQMDVSTTKPCRAMTVDVDFINSDGLDDETQFDIKAYDEKELDVLFSEFCKENGFKRNTVQSVTIVQMADSLEALE